LDPPPVHLELLSLDPAVGANIFGGKDKVHPRVKFLGFMAMEGEKQVSVAKEGGKEEAGAQKNEFGNPEQLQAIEAFIAAGSKPAYLGFGSMTAKSPEHMVVLVVSAAKRAGMRAIVGAGWAKMSQDLLQKSTQDAALVEYSEKNVLFVGNTPHEWLFPKCSMLVHHGGAGTTSTASRAGVPQIITPVWMDQWDLARFLNESGNGFGFGTQLTQITSEELGDAMVKVQKDDKIAANAKKWGETARTQTGTQTGMEWIEAWYSTQVATGLWAAHVEECKQALK